MTEKLLSAEELAARLGIKPSTVRTWSRSGKIPTVVLSSQRKRFDWEDVLKALKKGLK